LNASDGLDGLVRSVIQHHGECAAYVFAGSDPSMMRALFTDRERPFYGQARPVELPVLPADEAGQDIRAIMEAEGVDAPPAIIDGVLDVSGGHPQRTALIAHHLFNALEIGTEPDVALDTALERSLREAADALLAAWDGLTRNEKIVVASIADGKAVTGSRVADEHRIPRSTLVNTLNRLLDDEQIVTGTSDGRPALVDPLFAVWLRRR